MDILFFFTIATIIVVFVGFMYNLQTSSESIPHWFLISMSAEILLYVLYYAFKRYIVMTSKFNWGAKIILHDLMFVAILLYIKSFERYAYIASLLVYYVTFFGMIVWKYSRVEDKKEERVKPRKTFVEMTNN